MTTSEEGQDGTWGHRQMWHYSTGSDWTSHPLGEDCQVCFEYRSSGPTSPSPDAPPRRLDLSEPEEGFDVTDLDMSLGPWPFLLGLVAGIMIGFMLAVVVLG